MPSRDMLRLCSALDLFKLALEIQDFSVVGSDNSNMWQMCATTILGNTFPPVQVARAIEHREKFTDTVRFECSDALRRNLCVRRVDPQGGSEWVRPATPPPCR
jgi:hypothetical protein